MNRISAVTKEALRSLFQERTCIPREKRAFYEVELGLRPDTKPASTLILDFPDPDL